MIGRLPVLTRASAKIRSRFGVRLAEIQPEKTNNEKENDSRRSDTKIRSFSFLNLGW
jgi:hypothetical protein